MEAFWVAIPVTVGRGEYEAGMEDDGGVTVCANAVVHGAIEVEVEVEEDKNVWADWSSAAGVTTVRPKCS